MAWGKLDIEHFSQTDCHIAVTAEIKINLKGISQYHQKRGGGVQKGSLLETGFSLKHILLPLGISFFTFQQLSFIIDRCTGRAEHYSFIKKYKNIRIKQHNSSP